MVEIRHRHSIHADHDVHGEDDCDAVTEWPWTLAHEGEGEKAEVRVKAWSPMG